MPKLKTEDDTGGAAMTDVEQRAAAKHFAEYWQGKGYEQFLLL